MVVTKAKNIVRLSLSHYSQPPYDPCVHNSITDKYNAQISDF